MFLKNATWCIYGAGQLHEFTMKSQNTGKVLI